MKTNSRLRPRLRGVARASFPALAGLGLLAFAFPGTAGAGPATYTMQAKSSGLVVNVFGTQVTGGTAEASVDSGAPSATAEGTGTLTPALTEDQKAAASSANKNDDHPKACAQLANLPAASPVGVTLGLACSSATASLDSAGAPAASAMGEIAGLDVNASSLLNQIISSGGDQLFTDIQQVLGQLNGTPLGTGGTVCPDPNASTSSTSSGSSSTSVGSSTSSTTASSNPLSALVATASVPGSPLNSLLGSLDLGTTPAASSPGPLGNLLQGLCQTLTNIENVVKGANPPSTLVIKIGPASASVTGTASNTARARAEGATTLVQVLPGVGCSASSLVACITNPSAYAAPLIEIKVAPTEATDSWDGTNWTPTTTATLATVDLNIPGYAKEITLAPGLPPLDLLPGTPLETVVDLSSATTSHAGTSTGSGSAHSATLDIAKGIQGGILVDLGSTSVTGGDSPATPALAPSSGIKPPTVVAAAPVASPTLVHTGAWWSGSLPYIVGLAVIGGGLLSWPRLRRSGKGVMTLLRAARR